MGNVIHEQPPRYKIWIAFQIKFTFWLDSHLLVQMNFPLMMLEYYFDVPLPYTFLQGAYCLKIKIKQVFFKNKINNNMNDEISWNKQVWKRGRSPIKSRHAPPWISSARPANKTHSNKIIRAKQAGQQPSSW